MPNNLIILTDAGDEQPGTSITTSCGLKNKTTVQALPKPPFNEWAKYINKSTKI